MGSFSSFSLRRVLGSIVAFTVTIAGAASVPEMPEIEGSVYDYDTNQPIPNAVVVAQVSGTTQNMHGGREFAVHCIAVSADKQGHFRIPAWRWSQGRAIELSRYGVLLVPYHRDFVFFNNKQSVGAWNAIWGFPWIKERLPMQRFAKREDIRAWGFKVGIPIDLMNCGLSGDAEGLQLFWDAIHTEVEELAHQEQSMGEERTHLDKLLWITKGISKPQKLDLAPGVGAPILSNNPRVNPNWPGQAMPVEASVVGLCQPTKLNSGSHITSIKREEPVAVVRVETITPCGVGTLRKPFAGYRIDSIRLSWEWEPASRTPSCACARQLEFRISGNPPASLPIELSPE